MRLNKNIALLLTVLTPTLANANNDLFNWYGSIRVQLEDTSKNTIEYKDNYSRLGTYGKTDILDGIKATYNVEFRLFTDDGSFAGNDSRARLANIGLEGDFGSILIGKQYSPQWNFTENAIDIFADIDESAGCTNESSGVVCHTHRYGLYALDAAGNGHYIELLRPDRAITYTTPDIKGFQASVMIVTNNGDVKSTTAGDKSESLVGYNAAAKYTIGDVTVSASRFDLTGMVGDNKVDSFQIAYKHNKLSLAARYQDSSDMRFYEGLALNGEIVDEQVVEAYIGYEFDSIQLQATYATVAMDSSSGLTLDTNQVIFGGIYKHKVGTFYLEYSAWGNEAEAVYNASDKVLAGFRFDF